jgi:hypothetical protein
MSSPFGNERSAGGTRKGNFSPRNFGPENAATQNQCDQTFREKIAQNCPKIAQKGACLNKNCCYEKLSNFGNLKTKVAQILNLLRGILGNFFEKNLPK